MTKKILAVEDDKSTLDFIREVLEKNNYGVVSACNSNECFYKLKRHPDTQLVLLDIMISGRSGWDIFMEIRRSYPELKVVFVSAIDVSKERKSALVSDEGLADYINKPFTQEKLLEIARN